MNTVALRQSVAPRGSSPGRASQRTRRDLLGSARTTSPQLSVEARLLSELANAHEDVRASIQAAFYPSSARLPDLVALRGELRRRLQQLLEVFVTCSNEKDASDALVPFVFFVDEQVERALLAASVAVDRNWPQLQREFTEGRAEGGDVFFEHAELLLAEPAPRPVVVAAYIFCLKASFRGRLADEPEEAVDRWIEALAALLPVRRKEPLLRASWRAPRPRPTYVVVGLVLVFAWHLIVLAWAYLR